MLAYAGADIIIADAHKAQRLAGIRGKAVELDAIGDGVAGDILCRDREVTADEVVECALHLGYLLGRGTRREVIVYLRLLALDVCIARALTPEHPHHGLVE